MNAIWKTAITVTGSVGVMGLIFSIIIREIYSQEVMEIFGSDRVFYITVFLICTFSVALIIAIFVKNNSKAGSSTVIYKGNSTHKGDNRF